VSLILVIEMILKNLIALTLILVSVCSNASTLCANYESGDPIILVSVSEDDGSEFYADWEYYLNGFVSSHQDYKTKNNIGDLDPYIVIFTKKDKESFLLDGMPEPLLYSMIDEYYKNTSPKREELVRFEYDQLSKIEGYIGCD
jgi:hypothetical protein